MWNLPVGESWQVATPPPGEGRPKGVWLISAQVSNQPELRTSLMWPREPGSPSMPQRWHQILLGSASGISNTNEGLQTVSTPHPQPWTLALMALTPVPWVFAGSCGSPGKRRSINLCLALAVSLPMGSPRAAFMSSVIQVFFQEISSCDNVFLECPLIPLFPLRKRWLF